MKFPQVLIAAGLFATLPLRAVYAPIPEHEQGKDLTVTLRTGFSYDSNIFGGSSDAIGSNIWQLAPRVSYNASLTDQTFLSAAYGLTLDEIERRPGEKLLDSHELTLRAAHAFSQTSTIDLNDVFMVVRNPESLLNGVPVNVDQSFTRNQFDGRYGVGVTAKAAVQVKARSATTQYRNGSLGRSLDRTENLYGLAGDYAVLPETRAVAELRHQDVYYRKEGEAKNKTSDYLMAGVDYEAARKLTLSARAGLEWRRRAGEDDTTSPYAEISGRYQYAEQSFVTGGYAYTFDESSDPRRFTDQKINRLFINVQHAVTAMIVASASIDYEPGVLQARRGLGISDLDETATRAGVALSYLPRKNWVISASYDFDRVNSDEAARSTERHRIGMSASYTF